MKSNLILTLVVFVFMNVQPECKLKSLEVDFFGYIINLNGKTPENVQFGELDYPSLMRIQENFSYLEEQKWDDLIDCIEELALDYKLDKFGQFILIEKIISKFYNSYSKQDFTILKWYLYSIFGYDCLLVFDDQGNMKCGVHSVQSISNVKFATYLNKEYYFLDKNASDENFNSYTVFNKYDGYFDKIYSLNYSGQPPRLSLTNELRSENIISNNKEFDISYLVNRNMFDYLDELPEFEEPALYNNSNISLETQSSLFNSFKKQFDGKTEIEKITILLNFCQQGIDYIPDSLSGPNNWQFPEETIIRGLGDCEDKSILFSYLVNNLLQIQTVILKYKINDSWGHVNVGVMVDSLFDNSDLTTIQFDGEGYLICEPSAIDFSIGQFPKEFINQKPTILYQKKL